MHRIKGEKMLDIADETIENGNAAVKAEAVKIMANYPHYEKVLLSMLGESKSVREEVMKALAKMGSKAGIDKMMEIYKSDKSDTVLDALSYGGGEYLSDELLKVAYSDYEALKKSNVTVKEVEKLKDDIKALGNKRTNRAAQFLMTMLTEDYLKKAEAVLPKEKKQGYYYETLEDSAFGALHRSGKGNDFIWEMFEETQGGLLNKILKISKSKNKSMPKMLNCYAFYIGAEKLDPDKFYNTFFKTHLYKDIVKNDYSVFENVFLDNKTKNSPQFSKKIAGYFAEEMNDYNHLNLAAKIVSPDDNETLNLLAERLKSNLEKNSYGYVNYNILKRLGEVRHKDFKKLYELYCSKNHGNASQNAELEEFLN